MIGRAAHVAISGYILYINVICRGPGKSAVSGDELKISRLYLHLDYPSALLSVYTGISCRTPLRIRYSALLLCTLISCGTPSLVTRTGANPVWVVCSGISLCAWHSIGVSCRQPAADIRVCRPSPSSLCRHDYAAGATDSSAVAYLGFHKGGALQPTLPSPPLPSLSFPSPSLPSPPLPSP